METYLDGKQVANIFPGIRFVRDELHDTEFYQGLLLDIQIYNIGPSVEEGKILFKKCFLKKMRERS